MSHHHQSKQDNKVTWIIGGIIALFFIIAIGLVLSSTKPEANTTQAAGSSSLTAPELRYDFGTVSMANGVVTRNFEIENNGDSPVTIRKVYSSCMCTSAALVLGDKRLGPFGMPGHGGPIPAINQTIAPGEKATVEVTFNPAAHGPAGVGPITRNVFVESENGEKLTLEIKAQVTP